MRLMLRPSVDKSGMTELIAFRRDSVCTPNAAQEGARNRSERCIERGMHMAYAGAEAARWFGPEKGFDVIVTPANRLAFFCSDRPIKVRWSISGLKIPKQMRCFQETDSAQPIC
jgi:hypothetical protein